MTTYAEEFARDGYTVVPGLFPAERIAAMLRALERTIRTVNADPASYVTRFTIRNEETFDTWGVNDILCPELYEPSYAEVFENDALMTIVREIMGEKVRFWAAHALWSPERVDYDLNWHRDFGDDDRYDAEGGSTHIYLNVCLVEESCFRVVPGSNRRPLTALEKAEQDAMGFAPLPGELSVDCRAGDVLLMNGHSFHRGACPAGRTRRCLHIAVQPQDEPTGGHGSWKYIRQDGFLDTMPPAVRELMENLITWEDTNPLDLVQRVRRLRISKEHKEHQARRTR